MNPASRKREEVLNVMLAMCISARGIPADPEIILKGHKMPDVFFIYRGLRCVIEGKMSDATNAKNFVAKQTQKRVENGIAHLAVGVVYPKEMRNIPVVKLADELNSAQLEFFIHTENGPGQWHTGVIDDILGELRHAHESIIRDDVVERAVERLSSGMSIFSDYLCASSAVCDRLTEIFGMYEDEKKKNKVYQKIRLRRTAAQIAALSVANAFIFQEQLAQVNSRIRPLNRLQAGPDFLTATAEHWQYICDEINYVPIFRLAHDILLSVPVTADADIALRALAAKALEIIAERAALRHDLMGRIYHRLLIDAKFLGTYYTSVPSATLLIKLAAAPGKWAVDWSETEEIGKFRIADLACGTGTLLMAASQGITDNHVRAVIAAGEAVDIEDLRDLHQVLMEDVLYGFDVLASAVHLTASTLSLLTPEIAFRKMQLYILPLGVMPDSKIHLGSIDFLQGKDIETQYNLVSELPGVDESGAVTGEGTYGAIEPMPDLDLAVMNPPFVRSVGGNLLFGSFPTDRKKMRKELARYLRSDTGNPVQASSTAGLGSVFIATADKHLKQGGRLAVVIPAALASGVAWEKTRELLADRYVLEYVITSHDSEKWSFSENTDLSELLVVARKCKPNENVNNEKTTFVNLWRNPSSGADALAIGEALFHSTPAELGDAENPSHGIESLRIGESKYGEAVALPWDDFRKEPWIGGAFAQTELVRAAYFLRQGNILLPGAAATPKVPVCPLEALGELGPDCRDIHDGFLTTETATAYPAFWSHNATKTKRIALPINAYLEPLTKAKKGRPLRKASVLWPLAGRLMMAERMWFQTQRLFCVRLPEPALSNVWWPFRLHQTNNDAEKALALWLNSTLGVLIAAAHRVPTRGPWVKFKKPILKNMPVLNVAEISNSQLETLAKAYDLLCNSELKPLPALNNDPVRRQIDEAVETALGLPSLAPLSRLLAAEPIICNRSLATSEVPEAEREFQLLLPAQ
ncbi:MAG: hypothetical protein SVS15_04595 [Thermodesulfobacteriota bacterium]|nr:hypothetical protein [Thermodesulfobacteriota bacterium]